MDGKVKPEGIDLRVDVGTDTLARQRRVVEGEFDAAEFYMCAYISDLPGRSLGLTAIPVFVKRMFRHSYVYMNRRFPVDPRDLSGRRVGLQSWITTTAVWMKGILEEDYGVDLSSIRWVSEFTEGYLGSGTPEGVRLDPLPEGASLHSMLVAGELDAVISTGTWAPFNHPDVTFLFPAYWDDEREFYSRTRCFPIMHVLVVREELLEREPWVARSLYDAWMRSKQEAYDWLAWQRIHQSSMWFRHLWEEEQAVSGGDPYKWGFKGTRHEVERLLGYSSRQGLIADTVRPEDLFHPATLDT